MKASDLIRYGLWIGMTATADANRREYNMATTWLPHFLTNSLTLLFPDLIRLLLPAERKQGVFTRGEAAGSPWQEGLETVEDTLTVMIRDNSLYAIYAAPLAIGYILSHPRCNIYKGQWAEKRFCGLSFDALPHAATAFALTALLCDTVRTMSRRIPSKNPLSPLVRWSARYPALASLSALGLITLIWEGGEYRIHVHEMALRGDVTRINMMWSVEDTVNDVVANLAGWAVALLYDRARNANVEG